MIAKLLRLVGEVVRVYADTMSADKPRLEIQEIPLCSCCRKHRFRVNSHFVENNGKLVHKRDIDVSLAVLNDLCSLGNLDRLRAVNACLHDKLVHACDNVKRFLVHAGNDLGNGFQTMYLIAGIDTLRRVADLKINAAFQTGLLFENRHTNILCHAGIHGGLKHNDRAFCEILSQNAACALDRR